MTSGRAKLWMIVPRSLTASGREKALAAVERLLAFKQARRLDTHQFTRRWGKEIDALVEIVGRVPRNTGVELWRLAVADVSGANNGVLLTYVARVKLLHLQDTWITTKRYKTDVNALKAGVMIFSKSAALRMTGKKAAD